MMSKMTKQTAPPVVLENLEQAEAAMVSGVSLAANASSGVAFTQDGQPVTFAQAESRSFADILSATTEQAERVLSMAIIQLNALKNGARSYVERSVVLGFWLYSLLIRLTGQNILSWHNQNALAKRLGGRLHKNAYYIAHLVRALIAAKFPNWERYLDPRQPRSPYKWDMALAVSAGQLLEFVTNPKNLESERSNMTAKELATVRGNSLKQSEFGYAGSYAKRVFAALRLQDTEGRELPGQDQREQLRNAASMLRNSLAALGLTDEVRNDRLLALLGAGPVEEQARVLARLLDKNPELSAALGKLRQ